MHTRREFLRRIGLLAAAGVAADQLELLERLAPRRLFFAGVQFAKLYGGPQITLTVDKEGAVSVGWDVGQDDRTVSYEVYDHHGTVRKSGQAAPGRVEEVTVPMQLIEGEAVYVTLRSSDGTVLSGRGTRMAAGHELRRWL